MGFIPTDSCQLNGDMFTQVESFLTSSKLKSDNLMRIPKAETSTIPNALFLQATLTDITWVTYLISSFSSGTYSEAVIADTTGIIRLCSTVKK